MMSMRLVLLLAVLAPAAAARADDAVLRGDAAWARRGGDPKQAMLALQDYQEALEATPDDLAVRIRVLEALWFQGHFLDADRAQARKRFDRMTDLSEETVALAEAPAGSAKDLGDLEPEERARRVGALPHVAEAHFWAAISWGLWAMSHGNASSGFKGVAGRIRDHAEALIAIDERFADAGGLRLLGRLHAATPRVPMFTGWIDPARGIALLQRANGISTADPRNPLFLGEALLEHAPARRAEALALLREVAARVPDPAHAVEQQETIDEARRVLAEEEPAHESR
jgi:hypothetical protein